MRRNAFTLVELLVVTAIVAVLVAMLLPALNKARVQARLLKCLSGARQMHLSVQMYCNDNDYYYPSGVGTAADPVWFIRLRDGKYMNEAQQTDRGGCPDGPTRFYGNGVGYSFFDYYAHPDYLDASPAPWLDVARSSYGLNGLLQNGQWQDFNGDFHNAGRYRQVSPIVRRHERQIGLIFCSPAPWCSNTIDMWFAVHHSVGDSAWGHLNPFRPQGRHSRKGIPIVYCDGHAEVVPRAQIVHSPWDRDHVLYWSQFRLYRHPFPD